jgi:isoleucyl-tRNA synthetase
VRDEVNVKAVEQDASLPEAEPVWLDDALTSDLRREGVIRELIRFVQDKRKEIGLDPKDRIALTVDADTDGRALVEEFRAEITGKTNAHTIIWNTPRTGGDAVGEGVYQFKVGVSL